MNKISSLLLFCVAVVCVDAASLSAQVVYEDYTEIQALLRIGPEPERQIQMTQRGHTLILPDDTSEIAGVAIFFQRGRVPVEPGNPPEPGSFDAAAFANGIAVIHVATGHPLDFFFHDSTLAWVATHIQDVLTEHDMREVEVYLAGLSLGGTRALKLAQFLIENDELYWLRPTAVAVVDAPLDMERMWYNEIHNIETDFHPAAADEGRWVTYLLEQNLGGSPQQAYDAYVDYSVYTHTADNGGRVGLLADLPIRAYHEPDVNWWIENRRKDYYHMNSLDLAAMVNRLNILGNERAELVTTCRRRDGYVEGSSPHTWSIVNNYELVGWFVDQARQGH